MGMLDALKRAYQLLMEALRNEPEIELDDLPDDEEVESFMVGAWLHVISSNVEAIRYLPPDSALEIEYKNHGFYRYEDISPTEARSFATAPSKGKWVWDHLRVRGPGNRYAYKKPYSFISGPSTYQPKWMESEESRRRHGAIGPSGVTKMGWLHHTLSVQRAPKGGTTIGGKFFDGGKFIPAAYQAMAELGHGPHHIDKLFEHMAKSNPDMKRKDFDRDINRIHKAGHVNVHDQTEDSYHVSPGKHKEFYAIKHGELGHVQGFPVRRTGDNQFRLQEIQGQGHVQGEPEDVMAHIDMLSDQGKMEKSQADKAIARADAWDEPDPFKDADKVESETAAFHKLPHGARVVSLDANTKGRLGKIVSITENGKKENKVVLDGIAGYGSNFVEPLDTKHTWRSKPGEVTAPPKAVKGKRRDDPGQTSMFGGTEEEEAAPVVRTESRIKMPEKTPKAIDDGDFALRSTKSQGRLFSLVHHDEAEMPTLPCGIHKCHVCGEQHEKIVNAFELRNESLDHQRFELIAMHHDFPGMIAPGEVWITDRAQEGEKKHFMANANAQAKALDAGDTPDQARSKGMTAERASRASKYAGKSPEDMILGEYCHINNVESDPVCVKLVDGGMIRSRFDGDFTLGGNAGPYAWIPANEIWIDCTIHPDEMPIIALHHYVERWLMLHCGLGYDEAHDFSSQVEFVHRKSGFSKEELAKVTPETVKPHLPHKLFVLAVSLSSHRAPSPGVWVNGKFYAPGQFIPGAAFARASPQEKAKILQASRSKGGISPNNAGVVDPYADYQINRTKSQAFISWFGNWPTEGEYASKVVDDSAGLPLPVYPTEENPFQFAQDPEYAKKGAKAYYINVKNPFDANTMTVKADNVPQLREQLEAADKDEMSYSDIKEALADDTNRFLRMAGFDGITFRVGQNKDTPGRRIWEIMSPEQARDVATFQPYVLPGEQGV